MRTPEFLLLASLAACDPPVDPSDPRAKCDLQITVDQECPTEPCPAIAMQDPFVKLRTTVKALVTNVGAGDCKETDAKFILDDKDLSLETVPALRPGENAIIWNDQSVFAHEDMSAPAVTHLFEAIVNPSENFDEADRSNNSSSATFTPTIGVNCIVKSHYAEYLEDALDLSDSVDGKCSQNATENPFADVNYLHPYCPQIKLAKSLGWVSGEDGDGAFNPNVCTNNAVAGEIIFNALSLDPPASYPCADVPATSKEWYRDPLNAAQLRTGAFNDMDGNCNPSNEVARGTMELIDAALRE